MYRICADICKMDYLFSLQAALAIRGYRICDFDFSLFKAWNNGFGIRGWRIFKNVTLADSEGNL
jgi:hypothetical protein